MTKQRESPDPMEADPLVETVGERENTQLHRDTAEGKVKVPPVLIDGQEVVVFELDPDGETRHFHAQRMAEKIVELIAKGKKTFDIQIPFLTTQVTGNMVNKGFYYVELFWRDILENGLTKNIKSRCGATIKATVSSHYLSADQNALADRIDCRIDVLNDMPRS